MEIDHEQVLFSESRVSQIYFELASISKTVILFCLFYSRIQAASQSKKGLSFPNFWRCFSQPEDFIGIYSQIQKAQAVSP